MKKTFAGLICALCAACACAAAPKGWTTDFAAAQKEAEKEQKAMIVLFTGSDWCPWCVRLADEILLKKEFASAVQKDFVPVYLDFPQDDSRITPQERKANEALARKYGIRGYPTLLVMDAKGSVKGKTGYQRMTPADYLEHLRKLARKAATTTP